MKNEIQNKIIHTTVLVLALFFSISAQSATCSLRSDTLADTQDLGEFVKAEMTGFKKVSLNMNNENRHFKIDRNNPVFKSLNSDGILTSTENVDLKKIKSGQQGYAQAIPITKCHWLTNLHVVNGIAKERKEQLQLGTKVFGSFGQGVACEGKESFKVAGVSGVLAGFNPKAFRSSKSGNGSEIYDHMDWAVIKSSRVLNEVPVARISETDFTASQAAIMTGTPQEKLDEQGFGILGGQIVRGEEALNTGVVVLTDKSNKPGKSAGGVYKIGKKGLGLAAIYVGDGNVLNLSAIFEQMAETNPELYEDVMRVAAGGTCK